MLNIYYGDMEEAVYNTAQTVDKVRGESLGFFLFQD